MDERVSKEQAGLPTKDISKFLCEFDTVRQGYHFINPFSSPVFVGGSVRASGEGINAREAETDGQSGEDEEKRGELGGD